MALGLMDADSNKKAARVCLQISRFLVPRGGEKHVLNEILVAGRCKRISDLK